MILETGGEFQGDGLIQGINDVFCVHALALLSFAMTRHAFNDSSAGHMIIRPALIHMSPDLMQPFWGEAVTVMSSLLRFISST
jgi:hypothetical protein